MPAYEIHATPNPDSLKFSAQSGRFIAEGMVSASAPEEAGGNELAARLCALEGIANVFMLPQFLTITKRSDTDWDALLPAVEKLLSEDGD